MVNGDIGACLDIERKKEMIQGNAFEDDFMEVWENRFQMFRRDRSDNCKSCIECSYKGVCLGDSAHTWDFGKDEPYYCVTELMKEA